MKLLKKIFSFIVSSLFLSGCSSINSSNFKDMSSAYRGVIEQYANDNILLNIVRTSKNMPMSFLDIPSVVGSGNLVGSANLSSSVLSSDPTTISGFLSARAGSSNTSYSPSVGMSISNGFTFTQASLDNSQFMQAFLKEVPLNTINFRGTEANLPNLFFTAYLSTLFKFDRQIMRLSPLGRTIRLLLRTMSFNLCFICL